MFCKPKKAQKGEIDTKEKRVSYKTIIMPNECVKEIYKERVVLWKRVTEGVTLYKLAEQK